MPLIVRTSDTEDIISVVGEVRCAVFKLDRMTKVNDFKIESKIIHSERSQDISYVRYPI